MPADCPELEKLERHVAEPADSPSILKDHVSACADCRRRIGEISENLSLFAEFRSDPGTWNNRVAPAAPMPRQIGDFAIIREIGRGGMGVVFEALQRQPERRVALKVLRDTHIPGDERHRLFEREIRALARLRHPGITAIYEAGTSEQGPFYSMEFIQGVSLGEFLRQTNPDLQARLKLFLKTCAAVAYAHQHGVIHRDLKPGNILVEEDGNPKILDFGLARITDTDVTGVSLALDTGRLVGTLAYMSPEQARGAAEEIDLRSDVYSLGVILFELLTGTMPYAVSRTSVATAVRSICDAPPRRPSSTVPAGDVHAKRLKGDLDTIVLKALEKSADHRYQSVTALAEDIERYLTHQPIEARSAGTVYQFRKFARRNRALVGGVAAVFLALCLGLVSTIWQSVRARQAEQRARAEAAVSTEISRFMTSIFEAVDPAAAGPDVRVTELLQRASTRVDAAFPDQPRVAAALQESIGSAYRSLALYREAEPHYQRALELARREFGDESREALRIRYILAELKGHQSQNDAALPELNRIHEIQRSRFGPNDADTLTTLNFIAVLTALSGDADGAEVLLRETIAGRTLTLGPDHEETLGTIASLGILLSQRGRMADARELLQQAYETTRRVHGPDYAQTIVFASHVATLARTPEELEAVEPLYRDIVERGSRVFGPEHGQTLGFLASLGQLLELRCKFTESVAVTRDLLERQKRASGERDPATLAALGALARRLRWNGEYAESEVLSRQCVALCRELHGDSDPRTLDSMYELIHALNGSTKLTEAADIARDTLQRRIAIFGDASVETSMVRTLMADVLRKLSRLDEASALAKRALTDLRASPSADPILTAWAEGNLGTCLRDQSLFADAEPHLLSSHEHLVAAIGACNPACQELREHTLELYRRWHTTDPRAGHDKQAADFESKYPPTPHD